MCLREIINGRTQDYGNNGLIPSPLKYYYSLIFVLLICNCLLLEEYDSMLYTGHLSLGSKTLQCQFMLGKNLTETES